MNDFALNKTSRAQEAGVAQDRTQAGGKDPRQRLHQHAGYEVCARAGDGGDDPTNATTAIINRICFMPASLRLTDSGVNAVGGGWDSSFR